MFSFLSHTRGKPTDTVDTVDTDTEKPCFREGSRGRGRVSSIPGCLTRQTQASGRCPVCGASVALRDGGVLDKHWTGSFLAPGERCSGSYVAPRFAAFPTENAE